MQIEEPRSYKTATGESVQDEGSRVPIVTEEGLHRCMNFRVAPVHKALVSASKVCRKGYRIILDSEPGQSCMLHKHANEWIGLREDKGVYVFDSWISPAMTVGRKRSEVVSLTPCEHNVDMRASLPHFRSKTEEEHVVRPCQLITSSWVHWKHRVCSRCWQ